MHDPDGRKIQMIEFDLDLKLPRDEVCFQSEDFHLFFNLIGQGAPFSMKEYDIKTTAMLDTAPLVGLYLLVDSVLRRYPYLFGFKEKT